MTATVLLTGATGYIGSHTWLALLEAGLRVVGVDDFSNSAPVVPERIAQLAGRPVEFERLDVRDEAALGATFARHRPDAIVHFAAFKAVGESMARPLDYYDNNLGGLVSVCRVAQAHGCRRFVFSSSATVYGKPVRLPVTEDHPLSAASVYGATKLFGERVLEDLGASDPQWRTALLRYFNPVGAHPSGEIGEDPRGVPNNLMPFVSQVAVGRRAHLDVFGTDYDTPDGTCVRDYIHILDLADGHVAALRHLLDGGDSLAVNLGTGRGYSVLEVVRAYEAASGRPIAHRFAPRRPGDVESIYADPALARERLGWQARFDLARMCEDSWRWQSRHPHGFQSP